MERVVVIIPTYNEAEVIEETILCLASINTDLVGFNLNVLIFDSASTDETVSIVQRLQTTYPWLYLQTEPKKSGLGSAYWQAMQYATQVLSADIVVEFDADLSHQPKYIPPMLECIKTHDVVLGSRYVRDGQIPKDWGWHRKVISVLGNYIARAMLTPRYKDFTSGFRFTRRAFLESVLQEKFLSNHYAYKLHLLWQLHKQRAKIHEFPIVFVDRAKGYSKLPTNSIFDSLRVVGLLRLQEMKRYFLRNKRA